MANTTEYSLKGGEVVKELHCSDIHYDSTKCDRALLKKHFDEADRIFIYGDWFDLMGGKRDPRSQASHIRPEYQKAGTTYINAVVEDSYNFLKDYLPKLAFMSPGNHETAVYRHYEQDPMTILFYLFDKHKHNVVRGTYAGWLINTYNLSKTSKVTRVIHYHHGYGGNAKRSKGMLNVDIDAANFPDADIVVSGHDHNKWQTTRRRKRLSHRNREEYWSDQLHLKLGTYKESSKEDGWEVEKGFNPSVLGGYFIEYKHVNIQLHQRVYEAN